MKRLNLHRLILDYEVSNNTLSYCGYWFACEKWISHSFSINSTCIIKDKRNFTKKKAKVIKITEKDVTFQIIGNKTKGKISIEEFIQSNYTLRTLIRLEYNGQGIYSAISKPQVLNDLFKKHEDESNTGLRTNQPVPEFKMRNDWDDFRLHYECAFNSYEQLFNWFTLSEVSLLMKNNVKIVEIQEFRDFVFSSGSREQEIFTNNPEARRIYLYSR